MTDFYQAAVTWLDGVGDAAVDILKQMQALGCDKPEIYPGLEGPGSLLIYGFTPKPGRVSHRILVPRELHTGQGTALQISLTWSVYSPWLLEDAGFACWGPFPAIKPSGSIVLDLFRAISSTPRRVAEWFFVIKDCSIPWFTEAWPYMNEDEKVELDRLMDPGSTKG